MEVKNEGSEGSCASDGYAADSVESLIQHIVGSTHYLKTSITIEYGGSIGVEGFLVQVLDLVGREHSLYFYGPCLRSVLKATQIYVSLYMVANVTGKRIPWIDNDFDLRDVDAVLYPHWREAYVFVPKSA